MILNTAVVFAALLAIANGSPIGPRTYNTGPIAADNICASVDAPIRLFSSLPALGLLSFGNIKACLCLNTLDAWLDAQVSLRTATKLVGKTTVKTYVAALIRTSAAASRSCWAPVANSCAPCIGPAVSSTRVSASVAATHSVRASASAVVSTPCPTTSSIIGGGSGVVIDLDLEAKLKAELDAKVKAAADLTAHVKAELDIKVNSAISLLVKTIADAHLDVDADASVIATLKATLETQLKAKLLADVKLRGEAALNVDIVAWVRTALDGACSDLKTKLAVDIQAQLDVKVNAAISLIVKTIAEAHVDVEAAASVIATLKATLETQLKAKLLADVKLRGEAALHFDIVAYVKTALTGACSDLKAKLDAEIKVTLDLAAEAKAKLEAELKAKLDLAAQLKAKLDADVKTNLNTTTNLALGIKTKLEADLKSTLDVVANLRAKLSLNLDAKLGAGGSSSPCSSTWCH